MELKLVPFSGLKLVPFSGLKLVHFKEFVDFQGRCLHCAPTDFLLSVVALMNIVWSSLRENRVRSRCQCRVVGNPGTFRSR